MRKLTAMMSLALALAARAQTNATYTPLATVPYVRAQIGLATNALGTNLAARVASHTNDAAAHLTPAQAQRIEAAITNETDEAALAALATNRVGRIWDTSNHWYEVAGNVVAEHFERTNSAWKVVVNGDQFGCSAPYPLPLADANYTVSNRSEILWTRMVFGSGDDSVIGFGSVPENGTWFRNDTWPLFDYFAIGDDTLSITPVSYVITNSFVHYLASAPPLTAETWSYDDMTAWMEDGHAGQLWATGLAGDAASGVLQGHLQTSGHLQAGDRDKIDGAVNAVSAAGLVYSNSVSQTVVWTNAAGAVTNLAVCERGVWSTNRFGGSELPDNVVTSPAGPGQISSVRKTDLAALQGIETSGSTLYIDTNDTVYAEQALYSAVEVYNQLPAPATTTVVVAEDKTVYRVDISTNVVLAFDTSSLNFTNREVNFRLDANIVSTNGFNVTFPQGWDFVPDLTVTGEYRFAVCATGPATMHVKQVYPMVYEWTRAGCWYNYDYDHAGYWDTANIGVGDTSTNWISVVADAGKYVLVRFGIVASGAENTFSQEILCNGNDYWGYKTSVVPVTNTLHIGSYVWDDIILVSVPTGISEYRFRTFGFVGNGTYWSFIFPMIRQANELEISAYNAGWRP